MLYESCLGAVAVMEPAVSDANPDASGWRRRGPLFVAALRSVDEPPGATLQVQLVTGRL